MPVTKVICPHYCTRLHLSHLLPVGQHVLCQRCGRSFALGAGVDRPGPSGPAPPVAASGSLAGGQAGRLSPRSEDDFEIELPDEECDLVPRVQPAPAGGAGVSPAGADRRDAGPTGRGGVWFALLFAVLLSAAGAALVLLPYFATPTDGSASRAEEDAALADKLPPPPAEPLPDVRPVPPPAPPSPDGPSPQPPPQLLPPPAPAPPAEQRPPPPPKAPPAEPPAPPGRLPAATQVRVNKAIDGGVRFLQQSQAASGTWGPGRPHHVGLAALPGLTLLECGASPEDVHIRKAARHVRAAVPQLRQTYDLALTILFLDRLGRPADRPLIQTPALRLVAGQTPTGGWSYQCPLLGPDDERTLKAVLQQPPALVPPLPAAGGSDNSNTQFALLGLWTARRHGLPLQGPLSLAAERFRVSQKPAGGWPYRYAAPGVFRSRRRSGPTVTPCTRIENTTTT